MIKSSRGKKIAGALVGAVLAWSVSASVAFAQEITVKHAQGETVLKDTPKRVLVQDMAIIDILDALGVDMTGNISNANLYPDYLKKYTADSYIKTGVMQEPDYETIAGANADLMIVASRSAAKYKELSRILPTIDLTVNNQEFLPNIQKNITTLGEVFGKQARAAEMNAALDAKFNELRSLTAENDSTAVVLVTNAGKLGIYGPKSRVGWIFTEAGFKPVLEGIDDRFHGGDTISFEFLLEHNPDWLFVIDRDAGTGGGGAAKKLLDNELVSQTTAWKKDQVVYLNPLESYLVMHGYTSVMNLTDAVMSAIKSAKQ